MHRFFVPPDRSRDVTFALGESDSRHAGQVLRLGPGDRVQMLDGAGDVIDAELVSVTKRETTVRIITRRHVTKPAVELVLLQAMLKGKALDTVLEKAVELGVGRIVLLDTERGVARIDPADAERKRAVWTQTLIEAAKQSGNPWLPVLHGPLKLDAAPLPDLLDTPFKLFVASLESGTKPLGLALRESAGDEPAKTLAIAIGPEGDFTAGEYAALRAGGAIPVSLGPLVLRAETAAIAALAILGDHTRH
jgi:16S rRNA (uracil1498-N3)-methyltransferase